MSALTIQPVPTTGRVVNSRLSQRGSTAARGHLYVVPDVPVPTPQRVRRQLASVPVERSPKVAHRAEAKNSVLKEVVSAEFSVADMQFAPEVKITWQVVVGFLICLLVGGFVLYGLITPAGAEQITTAYVTAGDSLWSIAAAHTPANGDVAEVVYQIKSLNGLSSEQVQIGQVLVVPVK